MNTAPTAAIAVWRRPDPPLVSGMQHLAAGVVFGADLREADMRHVNLKRADLRGACMRGANLAGAEMAGCDLREGRIAEAVVRVEDLERASGLAFFNSLRGWLEAELDPHRG